MPLFPVTCPRCGHEFESEAKPGAFCPRCGEIVKVVPGGAGPAGASAPASVRPTPARSGGQGRTRAAAILLGVATGLSLLMAVASLAIDDLAAEQARQASGDVRVVGQVMDEEGKPLPDVAIRVEGENVTATTNDAGRWNLTLPAGTYRLLFEKEGYRSVSYKLHAIDYPIDLAVPVQMEEGSGTENGELFARSSRIGFAVFFALAAAATLAAAVSAGQRTRWGLAVVGATVGVLGGLPLLLGAACSVAALVLLLLSRRDFRA